MSKEKTLFYPYSAAYAREHDELALYRTSLQANYACRDAIDQAIDEHYGNNRLDDIAAKNVLAQFGTERTGYILAATLQYKHWDKRFSADNRAWAKSLPVSALLAEESEDRIGALASRTHSGILNLFINQVRRELLLKQTLKTNTNTKYTKTKKNHSLER